MCIRDRTSTVRGTDEEPVVKSVSPSRPAPTPPTPTLRPEVNPGFFGWLWGNLFGQPPPPQQPKDERPAQTGTRPAKPDRHRRDRPGRRPDSEPAAEPTAKIVAVTLIPPVKDSEPEPKPKPVIEPVIAPVEETVGVVVAAETEDEKMCIRDRY